MENWKFMMRNINQVARTSYSLWSVLLTLIPMFSALAQTTGEPLSLDSILQRIERQNIRLKAYSSRGQAYQYKAKAATSWMAPMIGAGTFMTPYPGQQVMNDEDKGDLMFNLEQEIPNPSKQQAKKAFIQSQSDIEFAKKDIDLNELRAQAKNLYYTWLIAAKRIKLLKENERIINSMKQIEAIRYEYNQTGLSNVFKADAQLAENKNMLGMQEAEIARARAWLNSLMNMPGNTPFSIDTSSTPMFTPEALLDTTQLAEQRKDIKKMNADIETMRLGIESMKKESKPDFKIRFDHMVSLGKMMPNTYSIMGMVSIPIAPWSSKMYKNEVKAMRFELEAMQDDRKGMLVESQGMLYGMQEEIDNMQERVNRIDTKIIPALQRAMDANFQAYRENKQQLPMVLADWEALNMMQNNLLDEKLKLYLMIVSYEKELYK